MQKAILKKMHSIFNDPIDYLISINGIEYKLNDYIAEWGSGPRFEIKSKEFLINSKKKLNKLSSDFSGIKNFNSKEFLAYSKRKLFNKTITSGKHVN